MKRIILTKGSILTITSPKDHDIVLEALRELAQFKVEGDPRVFNSKNTFYSPGDESSPLFSEAYLYPLFESKDDAMMLLGLFENLIRVLGYKEHEVYMQEAP